jgi:hypothetical protein
MHREFVENARKNYGETDPRTADRMAVLGWNLVGQKKYTEAESVLRDCLTIREKKQPDLWTTFYAKSLLGEALLGQKMYAEAEPLLKAGYEGLKERRDSIPSTIGKLRLTEAVERLVRLNEAQDKEDEAAKWREELDRLKRE